MVKIVNTSYEKLCNSLSEGSIVCYGAGKRFDDFWKVMKGYGRESLISCCIDRCPKQYGGEKEIDGDKIPVRGLQEFVSNPVPFRCLVITNLLYQEEIIGELDRIELFHNVPCLLMSVLWVEEIEKVEGNNLPQRIPKVIHYCWFGKNEMPEKHKRYIETWERFCPDYEIKRWDESNYDITKNRYMYEAYKEMKWGFVPDFARLDIIYQYGGIYMDTDVELVRSMNRFLCYEMFCGFEDMRNVNFGLPFGAVRKHPVIKQLRDDYEKLSFYGEDGKLNLLPSPAYQTKGLEKIGLVRNGKTQLISNVKVFSKNYFCPYPIGFEDEHLINENTYAIHEVTMSWGENEQRVMLSQNKKQMKMLLQERMTWNAVL